MMTSSSWRRASAGTGLVLLLVLIEAGPAAAVPPRVSFSSPASGQQYLTSDVTVAARIDMPNGVLIEQAGLSVRSLDSNRAPYSANTAASGANSQNVSFPVSLSYNGRYRASLTAKGRDQPVDLNGPESVTETVDFSMAAPPARPSDVRTSVDASARTVALTWKANGEPDLLFYVVQRAKGSSSDFTVLGRATEPKFGDSSTSADPGADYRYQIVAVRSGVNSGEGISSDPSPLTADSTAKVPDPPPPPTTAPPTTVAGSGTGSGTSSGTGGTTGSTTAGGSGSSSGSTLSASNPGALRTSGTVALSGFAAVQNQGGQAGKVSLPRFSTPRALELPDPGFQGTLPFGATTSSSNPGEDGTGLAASGISATELGSDGSTTGRVQTAAFFAAGLLATVLLMHVLWVRNEVKRVPLEAIELEPEEAFAAAARKRAPAVRIRRSPGSAPQNAGPRLEDVQAEGFEPVLVAAEKGPKRVRLPRPDGNRRSRASSDV